MSLKLYYDLLSQPSRSLYIVLKLSDIPFEQCPVPLRNGTHMTDDYMKNVSKFQKVPVLHHNDFKLTESVAILRYLSRETKLPEKWYPKDSVKQAKVDEYLEWQHNNTRALCAMYFRMKWLTPLLTGQEILPEKLAPYEKRMSDVLDLMETLWLTPGPYVTRDSMTAADIWAATEIEQPRVTGYDPTAGRPILAAWLERVRKEAGPVYQEAHAVLEKMAAKAQKAKL